MTFYWWEIACARIVLTSKSGPGSLQTLDIFPMAPLAGILFPAVFNVQKFLGGEGGNFTPPPPPQNNGLSLKEQRGIKTNQV